MELSIEEGEIPIPIPIPINTNINIYGDGHNTIPLPTSNGEEDHHHHNHHVHGSEGPYNKKQQKVVRYRECLKNHAAAMGGNATDGCGEFMPSGEDGTIEAFNCSACHCHRNFHRKEVEGDPSPPPPPPPHDLFNFSRRKFLIGPPHHHKNNNILPPEALGYPTPTRTVPPHHMIMPYNIGGPLLAASESDEQEEGGVARSAAAAQLLVKKRHRTKFSQEQKEKMLSFAEKVGWKIQKHEESVVQQFCQDIGVKRRVLKVWMHNNKHNLAKKMNHLLPPPPPPPP
ncbi:PREDICTED: zinc-finger homeodomain protein 4-like isoform X2 [Lupinus angustifolius]|uniref:zinc-finger homeodomain protein 4-like isoform X2 n=1 Tax=Lupinus angustifolius TaxID=3871 RepID=UPI00092E9A36|nr:PREDICTED: zinc-finger homeodomain protein 4-like isoform X2 [Lupinus angustifolius]